MTVKRFTLVFALFALLTAAVSARDEVKGREFHAACRHTDLVSRLIMTACWKRPAWTPRRCKRR